MFKAIARLLSAREPAAPRFVPPVNRHTESVPAFRASLRAQGLTEAEASAVVVARTVAGMVHLHNKGFAWDQINDMSAARWLAMPTDERDYDDYAKAARLTRERVKLLVTCGLG